MLTAILLFTSGASVWLGAEEPFGRSDQLQADPLGFLHDWRRILSNQKLDFALLLRFLGAIGRSALEPVLPLLVMLLAANPTRVTTSARLVVGAASEASTVTPVYLGRVGDRSGHARVTPLCGIGGPSSTWRTSSWAASGNSSYSMP